MTESGMKILVALDGSDRSTSVVRYIAGQFAPRSVDIKLFNVHDQLPEGFRDIDKDLDYLFRISEVKAWDLTRRKQVMGFLEKAREILLKAGFDQERVDLELRERSGGIARDIIAEAENGYDAVVIARRGLGAIRGMIMGSVAAKLINSLTWLPLWVVGKDAVPGAVLVATDGSDNAGRVAPHLASMVRHDMPVELFHAVRAMNVANSYALLLDEFPPGFTYQESEKVTQWRATDILAQGVQMMNMAGFAEAGISSKAVFDVASRAGAIVARARSAGYGTIAMGRRGLSDIRDFPLGRVTGKVLHMAKGLVVCVVN